MIKKNFLAFVVLLFIYSPARTQCWEKIAGATAHSCALKTDGTLWATGVGAHGRLGDGTTTNRNYLSQVGADNDWQHITVSGQASVAIKNNGTLWHWGGNPNPNGPIAITLVPTQGGTDNDWVQVRCGASHCLALKSNGTIWVWGSNNAGQLGNPNIQGDTIKQMNADTDWAYIGHTTFNSSIAIKQNGTLWAWGLNSYGQLGDTTLGTTRTTPNQVGTDTDWEKASIALHVVAKKTNGSFWVWGANMLGQCGIGNNDSMIKLPMQMNQEIDWKDVEIGQNYTSATKVNNTLWMWGGNSTGVLGLGNNNNNYNTPQQVGTDTDWKTLCTGAGSSAIIKNDNTAWMAGENNSGQLGNGTNTDANVLIQLSCNPLSVSHLSRTNDHITVYPNPASSNLYIDADNNQSKVLYDMTGTPILQTLGNQLDVSQLPAGVYFLKAGMTVRKVIIE